MTAPAFPGPDAGFETLLGRIAHEPLGDLGALRARLVPLLRSLLDHGRAEAEARLLADNEGVACARRLSELMDRTVRLTHDAVVRHLYPADNPSSAESASPSSPWAATAAARWRRLRRRSPVPAALQADAWGESVVETSSTCCGT